MKLARVSTLLTGLVAGHLLLLSAPVALTAPASGSVTRPGRPSRRLASSYGDRAFDTTNRQRAKRDRRVLGPHACLRKYAVRQARKMADRQEIGQQDLQKVLADCHMSWVGENVAAGFHTGRAVVNDGWMDSPSHRENLLAKKFRLMTVAARKGDDGRWYAAQVFGKRP